MAKTTQSILSFLFFLNIITSTFIEARNIPDVKHPHSFIDSDGSFLIPGVGRVMVPDKKKGFNPYTYNPVTGKSGTDCGTGISVPGIIGDTNRNYIPGGDDTLVPNPGVEVPIGSPGIGTTSASASVPSAA